MPTTYITVVLSLGKIHSLTPTLLLPDRLELIIFDITEKKIDNHPSRLIIETEVTG